MLNLSTFKSNTKLTILPTLCDTGKLEYEDSLSLLSDVLCGCFYVQKLLHIFHISDQRIMKNSDHMNVFNERGYLFIYFSVGCSDNCRSTTRTHPA